MKIFKKDGEFNLTKELANLLDTILMVLCSKSPTELSDINLELRKCGFFISNPELTSILDKLTKQGLVDNGMLIEETDMMM